MSANHKVILASFILMGVSFGTGICDTNKILPPSNSFLKSLHLHAPFTLKYRVSVRMKSLAQTGHPSVLTSSIATLSSSGNNLLMTDNNAESKFVSTWIYDGQKTYTSMSDSVIAQIKPGLNIIGMGDLIMPGVGLPFIPCMDQSISDTTSRLNLENINKKYLANESSFLRYSHTRSTQMSRSYGTIPVPFIESPGDRQIMFLDGTAVWQTRNGKPEVEWATTMLGDHPLNVWEFPKHTYFQGLWLASEIHYARYSASAVKGDTPDVDADYELVEASPNSLPSAQYNLATHLGPNTSVDDFSGKHPIGINFNPSGGSFEKQRQRQLLLDRKAKLEAERGHIQPRFQSGIFLICALFIGSTAIIFWKRRAQL